MVTGEAIPPLPPRAKVEIRDPEGTSTRVITRRPSLSHWDLEPESDSDEYMAKYEKFLGEYEKYREKLAMASGTISSTLEQSISFKFDNSNYVSKPKELWEAIKLEFEGRIKLDGRTTPRRRSRMKLWPKVRPNEWPKKWPKARTRAKPWKRR
jgi:hypothetical protein